MITEPEYTLDQHAAIKAHLPKINHEHQSADRWTCIPDDVYSMDRETMLRRLGRLELCLSEALKATKELLDALEN